VHGHDVPDDLPRLAAGVPQQVRDLLVDDLLDHVQPLLGLEAGVALAFGPVLVVPRLDGRVEELLRRDQRDDPLGVAPHARLRLLGVDGRLALAVPHQVVHDQLDAVVLARHQQSRHAHQAVLLVLDLAQLAVLVPQVHGVVHGPRRELEVHVHLGQPVDHDGAPVGSLAAAQRLRQDRPRGRPLQHKRVRRQGGRGALRRHERRALGLGRRRLRDRRPAAPPELAERRVLERRGARRPLLRVDREQRPQQVHVRGREALVAADVLGVDGPEGLFFF